MNTDAQICPAHRGPRVCPISGDRRWWVLGPLRWWFAIHGRKWLLLESIRVEVLGLEPIEVPAGFVCDGASVPQLARSLCPNAAFTLRAGIVHDYLYRVLRYDRAVADQVFLAVLMLDLCPVMPAFTMWMAVRWCGWWPYRWPKTPRYIAVT